MAPRVEEEGEAGREERRGSPAEGAEPKPQTQLVTEAKLVRVTQQAVARIGPELRRLERLRDEVLAELQVGIDPAEAGQAGSLLAPLARILEHAIVGIEEGWVELQDCFSARGLARLRRMGRGGGASRPAPSEKAPRRRRSRGWRPLR